MTEYYNLLLKSFFAALGENVEIKNFNSIKVRTEVSTESRKRIDLIIESDDFVIGIENKVDHWLNNDLYEYGRKIDQISNGKPSFKVVLSKFHCCPDHGFTNLTYEVLVKHINESLPNFITNANLEYLTFLKDFLKNIENAIKFKDMIENKVAFEYFKFNYNEISILSSRFIKFKEEVEQKFWEIHQAIESEKLKIPIKQNILGIADVSKTDIEDINGNSMFWINVVGIDKNIQFEIYVDNGYDIYCYARSEDETLNSKIDPEINECSSDLNVDTKVIVQEIYKFIEQMMENVFR